MQKYGERDDMHLESIHSSKFRVGIIHHSIIKFAQKNLKYHWLIQQFFICIDMKIELCKIFVFECHWLQACSIGGFMIGQLTFKEVYNGTIASAIMQH